MKIIILLFVVTSLLGCTTLPNTKKITTKYGEFSYQLSGNGNPTIILEAGWGDDMTEWKSSLHRFEQFSQVFTYNRAGFKGSDSQNEQRDAQTIALELRELLKEANIPPPYILVGHSFGGLYMRVYANTYPSDVSAVIQIDATHHEFFPDPAFIKKCTKPEAIDLENPTGIPWLALLVLPNAFIGESKELCKTLDTASNNKSFPEVPLVVISAGGANQSQHKDLATLSPISKHIICNSCGHYVHQDKPELLTEALEWVFDKI